MAEAFATSAEWPEVQVAKEDERDDDKGPKPKRYAFFVGGKKYETDQPALTGAQIKAKVPDWTAGYGLMLEGRGDEPDTLIGDDRLVPLEKDHGPPRFTPVPPATYGVS